MWKQIIFYVILAALAYWVFRRVISKEYLGGSTSKIKWGDVLVNLCSTLVTIGLFYFPPRFMIDYGFRQSLIAGVVALLVCIGLMIFVIVDLRDDNKNERTDLTLIVNYSIALLMLAVNTCSAISFALFKTGLGGYTRPNGVDYGRFVDFYAWHFIDTVPVVKVWELLNVKAPMTIDNFWAGLPVLAFKLFVVLQIIKSFKEWLDRRAKNEEKKLSLPAAEASPGSHPAG